MSNLTPEQKIIKMLAHQKLLTDITLITAALEDPEIAEQIIGDVAPDYPGEDDGDCEHEALSNEEIQEVFDNDEEQKKEA